MDFCHFSAPKLVSAWVAFFVLDVLSGVTEGASQHEVNKHLVMGGEMLARGQLQDALSHYHAAVEGDPRNYLTYFKRGTVYFALSKAKMALVDFNKVLELKPDFTGARLQRAQILLKQGSLPEASADFYYVFQTEHNEDAYHNYITAERLQVDVQKAEELIQANDYYSAINTLSGIIDICPWSSYLRELRSECYVFLNDPVAAILDLKSTTKLQSDNTDGYFKLSLLYYKLGQASESLREVRECLKLDPEHKDCFPHYKKVKKIEKFIIDAQKAIDKKDYESCINFANKVLNAEDKVLMVRFSGNEKLCHCHAKLGQTSEALNACKDALEISKEADVLCDRAEAYLDAEMYDDAIRDYQEALEVHEGYHRAKEGIHRAQKLQKQSEKRDYYKILGVKRTASKREIIKAYRKAAQKWHPDNFSEGDEKKKAEKEFIDIAAAKEVLTDEEKRKKFDEGEDPLDPESGQHQHHGGFQFHQFHQFQHGSPFTFKFHFN